MISAIAIDSCSLDGIGEHRRPRVQPFLDYRVASTELGLENSGPTNFRTKPGPVFWVVTPGVRIAKTKNYFFHTNSAPDCSHCELVRSRISAQPSSVYTERKS